MDTITATATIASTDLGSNTATLTWVAGKHRSFVTLNAGPSGASAGHPVTVRAILTDISVDPQVGIAGASMLFTAGAASCPATTNAQGVASCTLTPAAPGILTLTAAFAGTRSSSRPRRASSSM